MSILYLIRHGQTIANEQHRYCGSTDLPLSANGRAALAEKHYSISDAEYFTSGMRRTDETLRLLFGDVPFLVLPAFREVDFGIFEMKTYEELKDTLEYQQWITGDNECNIPPEGESGAQMSQRVLGALPELLQGSGVKVLVTHGGVIAAILANLFADENKNRYQWQPRPGEGYVVTENGYQPLQ